MVDNLLRTGGRQPLGQELEREKQSQTIVNAEFQKCFETSQCEIGVLRLKLSKDVDL